MNIIIYYGEKGTGKSTQLASDAMRFSKTFNVAKVIVSNRQVKEDSTGRYLFLDKFSIEDLQFIKKNKVDWLYLACREKSKIDKIEKYFNGLANIYDVRETMFPFCKYINVKDGLYNAHFGGFSLEDKNKDSLLKKISQPKEQKEVTIDKIQEMDKFLDDNSIAPLNFSEWGLDYAHLMNFRKKIKNRVSNKVIVTDDEACAIANYNGCQIQWIEDLFYSLF